MICEELSRHLIERCIQRLDQTTLFTTRNQVVYLRGLISICQNEYISLKLTITFEKLGCKLNWKAFERGEEHKETEKLDWKLD